MSNSPGVLKERSFRLAIRIIGLYQYLIDSNKEYVLSTELLRGGTPMCVLVHEAQNAESNKDFVHKLGNSNKEIDESFYWLERLRTTEYLIGKMFEAIYADAIELLKCYVVPLFLRRKASLNV